MVNIANDDDIERIELLDIVSKKGLKALTPKQLERLHVLVEKKDYFNNKKAQRSKMKLLKQITRAIYDSYEKDGFPINNSQ
ncbi:MAG: hypothetical protein HY295_05125 [Thaumarchaeota archaeon]|nr:hypothetical protein [Nitrososphaerota archaeon]